MPSKYGFSTVQDDMDRGHRAVHARHEKWLLLCAAVEDVLWDVCRAKDPPNHLYPRHKVTRSMGTYLGVEYGVGWRIGIPGAFRDDMILNLQVLDPGLQVTLFVHNEYPGGGQFLDDSNLTRLLTLLRGVTGVPVYSEPEVRHLTSRFVR